MFSTIFGRPTGFRQIVRHICTSYPKYGGIGMKRAKLLPLLNTSRVIQEEEKNEVDQIVMSKTGQIVVCWHPETPFPYEMSKPLPVDVTPTESSLKVQALQPVKEIFRRKHQRLMVHELMLLTNTSKHQWFCRPKRRVRYRANNPKEEKRDREYL